jgi:hypothetical protein
MSESLNDISWTLRDVDSARVIVLSEMHNVTACRHAIRDNSLVRCKHDSMNVLMFAMTLMFQGVHNVSYLLDHNTDVSLNGPVLSKIHTNKTADTLYGYMTMTPERYAKFGMTQAFGIRSIGIIRRTPQKPLFHIDFKGISAGVHWSVNKQSGGHGHFYTNNKISIMNSGMREN